MTRLAHLFAGFALAALLLAGCGSASDDGGGRGGGGRWGGRGGGGGSAPTPAVEAVQARRGALPLEERLSGVVRARNQVDIYPEVEAPVAAVLVEDGDRVAAGQVLVRLRDRVFRDQLRQAEASLKIVEAEAQRTGADLRQLEAQLARTERLAEQNFESQQQLETVRAQVEGARADVARAEARVEQAEATVAERRETLSRTVIRAPLAGRVGRRNAQPGMRANPTTRLFTIGTLGTVEVEVAITEAMFGRIAVGQTARISAPAFGDTVVTARVSTISPFLEAQSFSAAAEIAVDNPGELLKPGMFVTVDVAYGESETATLVPKSALYTDPRTGARGVFVASTLGEEVPVEVAREVDPQNPPPLVGPTPVRFQRADVVAEGRALVGLRGLKPGAWVVAVGQHLLAAATDAGDDTGTPAKVRAVTWDRLVEMQGLQRRDLLVQFMEKHRRMAQGADSAGAMTRPPGPAGAPEARNARDTTGLRDSTQAVATTDTTGTDDSG